MKGFRAVRSASLLETSLPQKYCPCLIHTRRWSKLHRGRSPKSSALLCARIACAKPELRTTTVIAAPGFREFVAICSVPSGRSPVQSRRDVYVDPSADAVGVYRPGYVYFTVDAFHVYGLVYLDVDVNDRRGGITSVNDNGLNFYFRSMIERRIH